jgi:uncharacterized protein (DUF1330 family)
VSAYVISEVEIRDELLAARYRDLAAASIAAYGGTYPARGAKPVVAEGEFPAAWRAVVVEFPNMRRIEEWYFSNEYAEARRIREDALDRRLISVEGAQAGSAQEAEDHDCDQGEGRGERRDPRVLDRGEAGGRAVHDVS